MMYTLITLHKVGWTIQTFETRARAVATWEHVRNTLPQALASVVYEGATMVVAWSREPSAKPASR